MSEARMPAAAAAPLISCLCVTERRPAFMPWLLWCFGRQRWANRELVIVDSSPEPYDPSGHPGVRVIAAPPGTGVAAKRNIALKAAAGAVVAWFDDDDWQHPERLEALAAALADGAPYAGATRGWFVDLARQSCVPYAGLGRRLIFNSAGFRRDLVLPLRFPEEVRRASDSRWMQQIDQARLGRPAAIGRDDLFFWLCHTGNLSNPAASRRCTQPLDVLRRLVGLDAWGDTDEALEALRVRIGAALPPAQSLPRRVAVVAPPALSTPPESAAAPPVSLLIKATVLDAPYLDAMLRHMVAQARFEFAERVVVVDTPTSFAGKYRSRPRSSQAELDGVLERLRADGVIDRVQAVDPSPATVREVLGRYFGPAAPQVPTHAVTGGPIYATLFGLEAVATDHVLQMDADVFFYSGEESWVAQALARMAADPRLWLMMTHPGPPAGPVGASLSGPNARRAAWDAALGIWRFRSATTRYFLCDRRMLRGRLQPLALSGGHAPLEQCLGQALQRHGAFRGCLGDLASWHLHGWYHGEPFAGWAPQLAAAIAAGQYPELQRGAYDLRLDQPRDRTAWGRLLGQPAEAAPPRRLRPVPPAAPSPSSPQAISGVEPQGSGVPLAVVIPVRNRAGARLRNALSSLGWQTAGPPAQVIVVSSGSRPEIDRELAAICAACGAELLTVGDPSQPWNKPFALNCGIRATRPDIAALMVMDADMILAPNFLEVVKARLARRPPALVLCRSSDLPAGTAFPDRAEQLLASFDRLRAASTLRGRSGTGGIQAAQRSFFFEIRGYDEDLAWWGAMDGDVVNRARLMQLEIAWVEAQTTMLHQWHDRKESALTQRVEIEQARTAWRRNHQLVQSRSQTARRNAAGWGGCPD